MDTVKLGIVGIGWWGGVLAEGARATGLAEVVACFSRTPETREIFAQKHQCHAVDDIDAILEDPAIDGLLIATPHSTHLQMVERSAAAGKHAFVEKPLALRVAEAKRAAEVTAAAGLVLQVGHNRRRQPANRRLKAMIEAGELGTVLQLEGMHSSPVGHKPDLPEWRRDPNESPYGGMTGLGVHTVDTFHYLMGRAKRVAAFSTRFKGFLDLDEATAVLIEYHAGPLASISTCFFSPPVITVAVYGSDANAWNEEDGDRFFLQSRADSTRVETEVETIDTIEDELAEFARSIRGDGQPETGADEGIEVATVLEAIGRSVATGQAVDLAGVS